MLMHGPTQRGKSQKSKRGGNAFRLKPPTLGTRFAALYYRPFRSGGAEREENEGNDSALYAV